MIKFLFLFLICASVSAQTWVKQNNIWTKSNTGEVYYGAYPPGVNTFTVTPTPTINSNVIIGTPTATPTVAACGTPVGNVTPPPTGPFSNSNQISYNAVTIASTTYADGFMFYGVNSPSGQVAAALYTNSSSLPLSLVCYTPPQNEVAGFQFLPIGQTQSISSGTYWMAIYVQGGEYQYASGGNTWLDVSYPYFAAYGFPLVADTPATVGSYSIGLYLDTCGSPASTYTPTPTPVFASTGQVLFVGDSYLDSVGASATTLGMAYKAMDAVQQIKPGWTMANYAASGNQAVEQNQDVFYSTPTPGMGPYVACVYGLGTNDIGAMNGGTGIAGPVTSTVAGGISQSVTYQNYVFESVDNWKTYQPNAPFYIILPPDVSTVGGGGVTSLDPVGSPTPGDSPNYEAIHSAYCDRLLEVAASVPNVYIIDAASLMYGCSYDYGTIAYGHPNNEGHARFGAAIANALLNLNVNYGYNGTLFDWFFRPYTVQNGKIISSFQNKGQ